MECLPSFGTESFVFLFAKKKKEVKTKIHIDIIHIAIISSPTLLKHNILRVFVNRVLRKIP
jgi:hypothetical protein